MTGLIWYDAEIPQATQEKIDSATLAAFFKDMAEVSNGRWVRNALLDKRGEKTSWKFRALRITSTAQAKRAAVAINRIIDAYPKWEQHRLNVDTVELVVDEQKESSRPTADQEGI